MGNNTNSSTHKYTPIVGAQEIRLVILFPGKDQEDIKVALQNVELNKYSQFEALSYVWGSEDNPNKARIQRRLGEPSTSLTPSPIPTNTAEWSFEKEFIDTFNSRDWEDANEIIQITRNLAIVLNSLRYEDKPRILWIDAICINQGNLEEKGEQVNRMGSNYEKAQHTLVWLGPDAITESSGKSKELHSNIEFAFDMFREFYEQSLISGQSNNNIQSPMEFFKSNLGPEGSFSVQTMERLFKQNDAARALLQRPWWNRIWIVQETRKSKAIIVHFGQLTIDWNILSRGVEKYLSIHGRQVALPERSVNQVRALFAAQKLRASHPGGKNLLSLLHRYRWCMAGDPRDKIYGLLGLASKGSGDPQIEPNYKIDNATCYRETTLKLMKASGSLDILQLCPRPRVLKPPKLRDDDLRPLKLPSWVPDLSYDIEWIPEERGVQDMESLTLRRRLEGAEGFSFTATGNSQCCPKSGDLNAALMLQGFIFDTISEQSDILETVQINTESRVGFGMDALRTLVAYNNDEETPLSRVFGTAMRSAGKVFYNTAQASEEHNAQISTFRKWRAFAFSLGHYPTPESLETVFYRTMVQGDLKGDVEEGIAKLKVSWQQMMKRTQGLGSIPGVVGGLASALVSANTRSTFPGGYVYNQRLAKTKKGYLALVPYDTEIGDEVALLAGGKRPFVIRGGENGPWRLIGDCYIEGVMRGEQWKPELCKEMKFV